jgi:GxxExxY protein
MSAQKAPETAERLNQLSAIILDAAITVHKEMGPGLLETVYQLCLVKELRIRGLSICNSTGTPFLQRRSFEQRLCN